MILCAAHKAARVASESLVMNEMRVHVVITDAPKSDQRCASSVVNVPSGAGQARFRAAALSERCSFVNGATRRPVCGVRRRECRRTQVRLRNKTHTDEKATVETSKSPCGDEGRL